MRLCEKDHLKKKKKKKGKKIIFSNKRKRKGRVNATVGEV